MSLLKVKIPKEIKGLKRYALENALASSALEGLDNPKIFQKVIDAVESGVKTEDYVKSVINQIKINSDKYFNQFK